jgi:hypothetical protein
VAIYEAFRQKSVAGQYGHPQLTSIRQEELFKEWGQPNENEP